MKPVADWLTPGAGAAEAEIAALRAQARPGAGRGRGALRRPAVGQRRRRSGSARRSDAAQDAARRPRSRRCGRPSGRSTAADTRQRLDRLDAAVQGQVAELAALKEQLAGTRRGQRAAQRRGGAEDRRLQRRGPGPARRDGHAAGQGERRSPRASTRWRRTPTARSPPPRREVGEIQTQAGDRPRRRRDRRGGGAGRAPRWPAASPSPSRWRSSPASRASRCPRALTAAAASGVPTLAQLRDSYPRRGARRDPRQHHGQRRRRGLRPLARVPRGAGGQPVADAAAGNGARRGALAHGGPAAARRPRRACWPSPAQLPSEAAAAMSDWLDAARLRLGAEDGLAALDAALRPPTEGRRAMLWSILKVLLFLGLAVALAFGASWILETPGEVKIAFGGREFFLSPIGFLLSLRRRSSSLRFLHPEAPRLPRGARPLPAGRRDGDQPLLLAQPRAARLRRAERRHGRASPRATPRPR